VRKNDARGRWREDGRREDGGERMGREDGARENDVGNDNARGL
jgi:hypothetical protein